VGVAGKISCKGGSNGLGASLGGGAGLWKSGRGIFGVAWAKPLSSSPAMGGVVIVAANPRVGKFKIDSVAIETVDPAERKLSLIIDLDTNLILLIVKRNN
jgi:hypothetical protein